MCLNQLSYYVLLLVNYNCKESLKKPAQRKRSVSLHQSHVNGYLYSIIKAGALTLNQAKLRAALLLTGQSFIGDSQPSGCL